MTAPYGFLQTESVLQLQEMVPTREAGDALYKQLVEEAKKRDANDTLWGIEAVMDYNPAPHLEKIKARLMAINSGDDETNPPQLRTRARDQAHPQCEIRARARQRGDPRPLHPPARRVLEVAPRRVHEGTGPAVRITARPCARC